MGRKAKSHKRENILVQLCAWWAVFPHEIYKLRDIILYTIRVPWVVVTKHIFSLFGKCISIICLFYEMNTYIFTNHNLLKLKKIFSQMKTFCINSCFFVDCRFYRHHENQLFPLANGQVENPHCVNIMSEHLIRVGTTGNNRMPTGSCGEIL